MTLTQGGDTFLRANNRRQRKQATCVLHCEGDTWRKTSSPLTPAGRGSRAPNGPRQTEPVGSLGLPRKAAGWPRGQGGILCDLSILLALHVAPPHHYLGSPPPDWEPSSVVLAFSAQLGRAFNPGLLRPPQLKHHTQTSPPTTHTC